MGHNLWLHFGVDEHPFATYFDVHQGYRVLTHSISFHRVHLLAGRNHACGSPDPAGESEKRLERRDHVLLIGLDRNRWVPLALTGLTNHFPGKSINF